MKKVNSFNHESTLPYVGDFIAEVRRNKRMTQEQLADYLAIDYSRLGKWERGVHKFPVDLLPLVAQALNEDIVFTATGEIKIGKGETNMKNLKTVLTSESVRKEIERHVLGLDHGISKAFELANQGTAKENKPGCLIVELPVNGELKSFESHLYTNQDQSLYLLDSRLFDVETDAMEEVFLGVFYPDLTEYEECIEDVWDFDDWELVNA